MAASTGARFLRFGGFQLDLQTLELTKGGTRIRVPEQSIQILAMLLERPGEVVVREQLHAKLWPNGTIVEFEHSINAAMNRLRAALGDSADEPRFVETLPRRGYRFIFPVELQAPGEIPLPSENRATSGDLVGQDISHYHVLGKLGQGAIGVVYKAEDLKLGRTVALKFLTAELLEDQRARERFEREARAVAALNHPHIATLYEVGDHEGSPYLAMELVDGRPLKGPLPVKQAIDYGIQMADALAAAHAAGIVHSDLKPANILVTKKGSVKVVDFGLAKLAEQEGVPASTQTTSLAGTPGYMAPEQIEGKPADTRSDIFAFGCILYELLSGRRAFPGETITAALTAAATTEPKPLDGAPERLDELVRLCLRKNPESRLQHIDDARIMLEVLREGLGSGGRAMAGTRRARLWWVPATALLLAAVGLGTWMRWFRATTVAALKIIPLTTYPGQQADPALSPDGKQVAFSWNGETSDNFDIYVKLVDGGTPLRLTTNPASEGSPAWSPDGGRIAFLRFLGSTADILVIPSLGGQERKLGQIQITPSRLPCRLSWSPDGTLMAVSDRSPSGNGGIYLVSVETGEKRLVSSPPLEYIGDSSPSFSPDGRSLALIRSRGSESDDIYVVPMTAAGQAAAHPRRITSGLGPIGGLDWTPDGRSLVFSVLSSGDMALRIVAVAGGQPAPLPGAGEYGHMPSVSRHGNRLVYARSAAHDNIWRIPGPNADIRKAAPEKWIASTQDEGGPQFSPDGKRIAFGSARSGTYEVWTCTSNGRELAQLTSLGGPPAGSPRWSPDSRWIAFDAPNAGKTDIFVISAESGAPRLLTPGTANNTRPSWSGDGKWIYFDSNRGGDWEIWKAPAQGGDAVEVTKAGGYEPFESPDGKLVFYSKLQTPGIWSVPVEGGQEVLVLEKASESMWAVARDGICFLDWKDALHPVMQFYNFRNRRSTVVYEFPRGTLFDLSGTNFSVSPDERWILYTQLDQAGSNLVLVENFR